MADSNRKSGGNYIGAILLVAALIAAAKTMPAKSVHEQALRSWFTTQLAQMPTHGDGEALGKGVAELINLNYVNDPNVSYLDFFNFQYHDYYFFSLSTGNKDAMIIGAFDHAWVINLQKEKK